MVTSNFINSAGLLLDIIGVILLFKFGLPEDVRRSGASYFLLEKADDEKEKAKAKLYDRIAWLALTLLVMGFALQIVSNYLA